MSTKSRSSWQRCFSPSLAHHPTLASALTAASFSSSWLAFGALTFIVYGISRFINDPLAASLRNSQRGGNKVWTIRLIHWLALVLERLSSTASTHWYVTVGNPTSARLTMLTFSLRRTPTSVLALGLEGAHALWHGRSTAAAVRSAAAPATWHGVSLGDSISLGAGDAG